MSDEKLPEYVEEAIFMTTAHATAVGAGAEGGDWLNKYSEPLRTAIHRYAREREAAAMRGATDAIAALCFDECGRLGLGSGRESPRLLALNDAIAAIRALIPKEPTRG